MRNTGLKAAVLVSSASNKTPLLFEIEKSINRSGVPLRLVAGDLNPQSVSAFFDWDFIEMPQTQESHLDSILEIIRANNIRVVIPSRDGELEFWAGKAAELAAEGVQVVTSAVSDIRRMLDKLLFFESATSAGFPVIETSVHLEEVASELLVVKERWGSASIGVLLEASRQEALAHSGTLHQPVFQPFVSGRELSADVWRSRDGSRCFVSLRERVLVSSGESKVTTTLRNHALEKLVEALANHFALVGPGVVQIIESENQGPQIVEFNPRFGGASTASIAAGMPIIDLVLADFLDFEPVNYSPESLIPVTQVRYSKDKIIDRSSL